MNRRILVRLLVFSFASISFASSDASCLCDVERSLANVDFCSEDPCSLSFVVCKPDRRTVTSLRIEGSRSAIPSCIWEIQTLEELSIVRCSQFAEFPRYVSSLRSLTSLVVQDTGIISIPDSIANLPSLKFLRFDGKLLKSETVVDVGQATLGNGTGSNTANSTSSSDWDWPWKRITLTAGQKALIAIAGVIAGIILVAAVIAGSLRLCEIWKTNLLTWRRLKPTHYKDKS